MILSLTAAVVSFFGIQGLLWLIKKRQFLLDIPNERSSHTQPTPRGGGVVIVMVTMLGLWVTLLTTHHVQQSLILSYSVAALLVASVSWVDDFRPLSNRLRFGVHIVAALIVIIGVGYWQTFNLPILGKISIGLLGIPFTLIWIVGLINAYNFMDGIDGLAGTVALIAGSAWALIGYYYGSPLVVDLGLLVAASSLGFLLHNWFPAKIFMGDVGSAFLGLTFATLPLLTLRLAAKEPSANLFLATGMLVIWPFLFDSIFTFLRRLSNGEKVWEAHRSHLYQRLVIAGFRHSFVTVLYAGCTIFGVFLAVVWVLNRLGDTKIIVITLFMICVLLVGYVSSKEVKSENNGRFVKLSTMKLSRLRNRHFFLLDIVALALTPTIALMLRLDTLWISREFWLGLLIYTLLGLTLRPLLFQRFGVYSRYWRYASIDEGVQIVLAVAVSTAVLIIITLPLMATLNISFARAMLIIDTLLVFMIVGSTRFSLRFWGRNAQVRVPNQKRVIIIGAGDAGEMTARELQKYPLLGLKLVAFVDDDPQKQGLYIRNLPILGTRRDLPRIVLSEAVDQVIIAMPTVSGDVIREITGICDMLGVETKTIPGISEMMHDQLRPHQLRDVDIEDLLRREPVQTDIQAVRRLVAGKRVLVTGGGGSIGSELCRQLLYCGPSELLILGHGENSVFEIYHELNRIGLHGPKLTPLIADVRFGDRIMALFKQHRPQLVFHAAAHKHVPLMEQNPAEAITNNTLGTQNVVAAALAVNVERFVMISTDKAVNPTSVMGASKRSAELLVHRAAGESKRPFVTVRFGNVLGSRGSVVLTFKKQIEMGGPITITHPDIERYFMTIPEAVQLVLQSSVLGTGGEVFVLDMGQPVKIIDLARDLIRLSGLEVGRDVEIKTVGLRPGEKLYEELFVPGENYHRTAHEKIFIAENASKFVPHDLETSIEMLAMAAANNDAALILRQLQRLIPEYQPTVDKGDDSTVVPTATVVSPQRGELQTLTP
ncbi:MAG: polysaccharide biosynthesis protein [Ardenticatenaceae bacterium]|nr:polysaccharide biosynthesis protein [Ardenticatenaceae bacterium]